MLIWEQILNTQILPVIWGGNNNTELYVYKGRMKSTCVVQSFFGFHKQLDTRPWDCQTVQKRHLCVELHGKFETLKSIIV